MTPDGYAVAAGLMGEWLATSLPRRYDPAGVLPRLSAAVYVALDDRGRVVYVGSVLRRGDPSALSHRIREHLRRRRWRWIAVFPIRSDAPTDAVRHAEGRVGRYLRPLHNRRLPTS